MRWRFNIKTYDLLLPFPFLLLEEEHKVIFGGSREREQCISYYLH